MERLCVSMLETISNWDINTFILTIFILKYIKCAMCMGVHIVNDVKNGHVACNLAMWRKSYSHDPYEHKKSSNGTWVVSLCWLSLPSLCS